MTELDRELKILSSINPPHDIKEYFSDDAFGEVNKDFLGLFMSMFSEA